MRLVILDYNPDPRISSLRIVRYLPRLVLGNL